MYLIEESAIKEYCQETLCKVPDRLWNWLEREGPIIRAEPIAEMPNGYLRFRAPSGLIDVPPDAVYNIGEEG